MVWIELSRWEAFFGSAMDAADEMSDTMSETSLYSKRSMHSMRPPGSIPGTPGNRNTRPPPYPGSVRRPAGSMRGGSARGLEEAVSDASRDMGGLELEGWDEKFVYKVSAREGNTKLLCVRLVLASKMRKASRLHLGRVFFVFWAEVDYYI